MTMHPHEVAALSERATAGRPFSIAVDQDPDMPHWVNVLIGPSDMTQAEAEAVAEFLEAARTHWPAHAQQLCDLQREVEKLSAFIQSLADDRDDRVSQAREFLNSKGGT
jgi:hypothetical protein